ncbi:MAG TPA: LON peptidase substrate-binding domain-containing protein [Candidatus Acidoferrales bacterium]|nr:LON peptidase substrate-binding domain-containing protein [Candidatus Acidoferrales bacterium]
MAALPTIIPIFPLPNLVLFPGLSVPLHIFEPRYREMIADIADAHGIIGMMLLKGEEHRESQAYPDVFEVGCAGRIDGLIKLPDGRYNLALVGVGEFRVVREIRERSYRQAEVRWCPVPRESLDCDSETMEALREMLFGYLGAPAQEAWRTIVEQRGLRGAELINFLCFHLDVSPLEKQTMLEAMTDRVDCLLDVLAFKLEERKRGPVGPGGSSDPLQ